jgi:hypothetical protein
MLMRALPLCVFLGSVSLAGPARAQNDCLKQLSWPPVGRWASYSSNLDGKPTTLRYAAVGAEKREGVALKWIEMRAVVGTAPGSTYQMLLPGGPADIAQVQEVVMKMGDGPPMKMGGMMLGMVRKQLEENSVFSNLCEGVTFVGPETVKVHAGSFKSLHFHNDKYQSDTWISPSVPFALVKSVTPRHQIELQEVGDGAKSSITETPKKMPGLAAPAR